MIMVANPRAYRGRAASGGGGGGGGGETVSADVIRWDGNTGSVKVTTAWPLKPGVMFGSDMSKFVVKDDTNAEVAIGVSASRGLFPDGSLRSIHVQFLATLTNNTAKTYTVEIGGTTRTTANDIAYVEAIYTSATATVPAMNHKAVMIPASSQYWCDTFIALTPLKPEASEVSDSAKTYFQTASGTSATLGEWTAYLDTNYPNAAQGASTYEHCHGFLCAAIRADSQAKRIAYYKRFHDTLVNFCGGETYFRIGSTITDPYNKVWIGADSSLPTASTTSDAGLPSEPKSQVAYTFSCGYLATGWKQPWRHIAFFASWTHGYTPYSSAKSVYVNAEWLIRFNVMQNMFRAAAYVIGATMQVSGGYGSGRDNTTDSWTNDMTWTIDAYEEYRFTTANYGAYIDGIVGCRPTASEFGTLSPAAGRFPNFQLAVVAKYLIFYYHNIDDDARIPGWIQKIADFIIAQTTDQGTYYTMPYQQDPSPGTASPDYYYLPFFPETFGFAYAYTGTGTYKTWAMRAANARELTNPSPFTTTIKAFGEYFSGHIQSAKFYIDGGGVRPISGAHPTSISTRTTYTS